MQSHYENEYFAWQSNLGAFGGQADLFKFEPFIDPQDTVLDFGCGGGYILENLHCRRKLGIEINEVARREAATRCEVFESAYQIPVLVDCIISHHALEHVDNPLGELTKLYNVLRPRGRCIFVTPYENQAQAWDPNDINKHLFTWSPLNLGNLFTRAGFHVERCEVLSHTWPPDYLEFTRQHGWEAFHRRAREYSDQTGTKQVRIVASRP